MLDVINYNMYHCLMHQKKKKENNVASLTMMCQ